MNGQLSQMQSSGQQTDQLLKLYQQQLGELQEQTGFAQAAASNATQTMKNAEEFFRTDERAWIVVGSIEKTSTFPPQPPFGTIFKFSIFLKNTGKTVAQDVRTHIENPNSGPSFMENEGAIRMSQDQQFRSMGTNKRAITPDNPGPQTIAPSGLSPVPVFSGGQEPMRYKDGSFVYSYILGRIDYTDAFETKHWTHFCYFISNSNGDLAHCKYGNDQDSNPEPIP